MIQGFQEDGKPDQVIIPKEPTLTDNYDDLHARRLAFAYGSSAQRLTRPMNRASGQISQQAAQEEGVKPFAKFVEGKVNFIIQKVLGYYDYGIDLNLYQDLDIIKRSKADASDFDHAMKTANECREDRGEDPYPAEEADWLWVKSSQGYIPLHAAQEAYGQQASKMSDRGLDNTTPPSGKVNGHAAKVRPVLRGDMAC